MAPSLIANVHGRESSYDFKETKTGSTAQCGCGFSHFLVHSRHMRAPAAPSREQACGSRRCVARRRGTSARRNRQPWNNIRIRAYGALLTRPEFTITLNVMVPPAG